MIGSESSIRLMAYGISSRVLGRCPVSSRVGRLQSSRRQLRAPPKLQFSDVRPASKLGFSGQSAGRAM
jgi:hypothetical protein